MAVGFNGYRAAMVRRQLTPGLISSFPGTAGLPPFISFSTSYLDLDFAALRPSCTRSLENGFWGRVLPMESWPLPFGQSIEHNRGEFTVTFCRAAGAYEDANRY
jgi:hypothetical protein